MLKYPHKRSPKFANRNGSLYFKKSLLTKICLKHHIFLKKHHQNLGIDFSSYNTFYNFKMVLSIVCPVDCAKFQQKCFEEAHTWDLQQLH